MPWALQWKAETGRTLKLSKRIKTGKKERGTNRLEKYRLLVGKKIESSSGAVTVRARKFYS